MNLFKDRFILYYVLAISLFCTLVNTEKELVIHVVPHSHNDAGWLLPMDEYYEKQTKHILTNTLSYLISHPDKKFNWSDIAFFHMWWQQQDEHMKQEVKKLVAEDRLVFMGGGWVMNDEALPSYKETMLNMRTGLDFLKETFNVRPKIGWQIDPFGSSALTVAVLHKLGYEALVENRISANFKQKLSEEDGFNFYWQGHQVSKNKEETNLFTHIIQRHYNLPQVWSEDQFLYKSVVTYKGVVYNVEVKPTVDAIDHISHNTANKHHIMIHAGDDFTFVKADKL
jgi:hypothetical protein